MNDEINRRKSSEIYSCIYVYLTHNSSGTANQCRKG